MESRLTLHGGLACRSKGLSFGNRKKNKLDDIVESCYPDYPFASDDARLECLFKLYEKMTAKGE